MTAVWKDWRGDVDGKGVRVRVFGEAIRGCMQLDRNRGTTVVDEGDDAPMWS